MNATKILGVAALAAGVYWLSRRSSVGAVTAGRSASGVPYVPAPRHDGAWTPTELATPNPEMYYDMHQYPRPIGPNPGGGYWAGETMNGMGSAFLDSLTGVLAGSNVVKTQNQLNVNTSDSTVLSIAIGAVGLMGAAAFIGNGLKGRPRRRGRRR